ncbi:Protein of unknown function [Propionibacterium freudenreichii subsp. freudenreichii]|uniref:Uncharacterized protein n=2 Tax=Propionibacterium freudenreichii TaxID=1744 RepID=D7GEU7_PROFC|nr:Hypothetical protein PFREUD_15600 [Propionibacterium freudenreichii subsp. shermanii CIRM-BIA1]CDP49374.1 Protein of unknown function [Propionibacterium freudenreichii subsp. freudenreichii]CEG86012.1 Protein of unknown function [Propionibacterium freudenreichii]CEG91849.1 Protein of unknown function [Propionibacterium freudenreichii]CEG93819.1 Protein of unknown function [Propionibacterium freudenreichii]
MWSAVEEPIPIGQ